MKNPFLLIEGALFGRAASRASHSMETDDKIIPFVFAKDAASKPADLRLLDDFSSDESDCVIAFESIAVSGPMST